MKKTWLRVLGSLILVAILIWKLDLSRVGETLLSVQWGWWVGAVLAYVLSQVVSSYRWQILARPLGIEKPLRRYVSLYFVGTFFNQLLPTSMGGDVARAWYLAEQKEKRGSAFLSVLADRLSGLGALVLLACLGACFVELPIWILAWISGLALGLTVGSLVLLYLIQRPNRGEEGEVGIVGKLRALLGCYRGRYGLLAQVLLLSILVQMGNILLVWQLCQSVQASVSLIYCFILMPLVTLLTLLPVSINGMGVREGGMILLMAPLGIANHQAVTVSLLWLSVFMVVGLLGAGIYLCSSFTSEAKSDDGSLGNHSDQGRARESQAIT